MFPKSAGIRAVDDGGPQLHDESLRYLATRPKAERSPIGQFLTPRVLREALVAQVPLMAGMRVLDPGVGTGEFLRTCVESCPNVIPFGWDIDEPVLEIAKSLVPEAHLSLRSALDDWGGDPFDVVIGNPPYFEIRNIDTKLRADFADVIAGRPNIFALFFEAGWRVLRDGGYLAFVVPPSMNNGAYFDKLRTFILKHFSIEFLEVYNDPFLFEDVQTAVQLIVLRKGGHASKFVVDLGNLSSSPKSRSIFAADPTTFGEAFKGRRTLHQLGYKAVTGSVVWNTRKSDLHSQQISGSIPLVWAHNITAANYVALNDQHPKRPQFISNVSALRGPAIAVNRITGSVGSGSLRCALVPPEMEFVGENHVNVVIPRPDSPQLVGWEDLLNALRHPGINDRVRMLTGNTQVSATELTYWIPVDA